MSIKVQVQPEGEGPQEPDGWHELSDHPAIPKWQYKDSPYRVVCFLDEDRGHWKALFTTVFEDSYNSSSTTIAGNLGGGNAGRIRAKAAAREFMEEHKWGCPPPGEIKL